MTCTRVTSIQSRRPPHPGNLTDREHQVVALIARGCSNHEIAGQLYLSINSVKTYIRSAYRKIGVTRRTQAVIWAIAHDVNENGADQATG
ncbi:response regulator transcription factor [Nocardioides sp.]|uniref:response regulator transcription factor n=1 Tax=Nocardioides sp. TaxID=35761 RepID=UPI002728E948|nr:LuxR C-terminal-related transcriptional regulator [Nocardioides sp.]MDO9458226.1 LuxR C-terminal-related transcriptional regulator [Nocardioides sp.]